jgi:hypothetical protein
MTPSFLWKKLRKGRLFFIKDRGSSINYSNLVVDDKKIYLKHLQFGFERNHYKIQIQKLFIENIQSLMIRPSNNFM